MKRPMHMIATIVLGLGVLGLAGCGGGGGASGARLSDDDFIEKANAACSDISDLVDEDLTELQNIDDPTPKELQTAFRKIVPRVDQLISRLKKIRPPQDKDAQYKSYLAALTTARNALRTATSSRAAASRLAESDDPFGRSNSLAEDLDLNDCAA